MKKFINSGVYWGIIVSIILGTIIGLFIVFDGSSSSSSINRKPVLYLYPEEDSNVNITFNDPSKVVISYPEFNNSWNVFVKKDGTIKYNHRDYYALYWEEEYNYIDSFSEGFYVEADNAIEFLENKLSVIGLNEREANEFIMYWLPILKTNEKNLIYFELTEDKQAYNELIIDPEPDSLLRITMHVKKVDKKINVKEQHLTTFERNGFTVVEWGGINY